MNALPEPHLQRLRKMIVHARAVNVMNIEQMEAMFTDYTLLYANLRFIELKKEQDELSELQCWLVEELAQVSFAGKVLSN